MMGRNRRGSRQASMKAKLSIAAAVLVGGGAIGAVAVAASSHSASSAQSAGYTTYDFHHQVSEGVALSTALNEWSKSESKALAILAEAAPVKNFSTAKVGHTVFAEQRGVVVLATKHWLLIKSSNGSLHLWLLSPKTAVVDVAASKAGMAAMTGSTTTTTVTTAVSTMAGQTTVNAMTTAAAKPTTVTVDVAGSGETITVTVTSTTATVASSTSTVAATTGTPMTTTTQPAWAATDHIARGDLAFVAGVEEHGFLFAKLVLFAPPKKTVTPVPTTTVPTATATPTTAVSATPSASETVAGTKS
jgi:hypothetical protein